MNRVPLLERLLARVIVKPEGCWEWTGARHKKGYGVISVNDRDEQTHRVVYQLAFREIPDGLCVLHSCDNPPCVRPSHFFLGTRGDNNTDRKMKDRNDCRVGDKNTQAKLTDDQVRVMRAMLDKGGLSQYKIAAAFGVSQGVVSVIKLRKLWAHVA